MSLLEDLLISNDGVILSSADPRLRSSLARWTRSGQLRRVMPGIYIAASCPPEDPLVALAVQRGHPDAVFTDETAATLTFWPQLRPTVVSVGNLRLQGAAPGVRVSRRVIPADLVRLVRGLRVTVPELTALDLATSTHGESIDRMLRSRMGTLAAMSAILGMTAGRRGNADRRRILLDSRDEPWSPAERLAHRLLRAAGITGWQANYRIRCGGHTYYLDIAFPGLKVAIEIDGREHHSDALAFETDRERQNDLVADGWTVLRITWTMLTQAPEAVVRRIRDVLQGAAARQISRSTAAKA